MRPSFTVPPVPHLCFSLPASSSNPNSSRGISETIVTPLPRRPFVSLPTFTVTAFFGQLGGWLPGFGCRGFLCRAAAEDEGDEAHDLTFDQRQCVRCIINVPEFDLLDPRWKS